jgi:hypothetical protein
LGCGTGHISGLKARSYFLESDLLSALRRINVPPEYLIGIPFQEAPVKKLKYVCSAILVASLLELERHHTDGPVRGIPRAACVYLPSSNQYPSKGF